MGTYSLTYGDSGGKLTSFIDSEVNPDANYLAKCGECTSQIVNFMHEVSPYSIASTIKEKARRRHLKKNKPFKVSDVRRTPFTVSFTMTLPDGTSMPVDLIIVPNLSSSGTAGTFSPEDLTNIYQEMKAHPEQRDYYAKCLSPVQVSFVKSQPEKVKRAIRLTKDWAKSNQVGVL
ncbi:unnamed protein product [Mytilus edulis]|uniref:2'-5'-oligoadenylate synthetase 1 domain-containing protein n=1 Tax=Mytilus edulis TaxID=6550 RepID=A0A8S3VPM0_MYTED|nr:unnamed protein product [Mytilus edulis]